jgi:dTDP-4-dehydrorhamnose reductase
VILVLGAGGQLGTAFRSELDGATLLTRADIDLSDISSIRPVLASRSPSAVINCAAYTGVDRAEDEPALAHRVNAEAVGELAAVCADIGARLVTYSTDYVFDGRSQEAYVESSEPNPQSVYGASKLDGERRALGAHPETLVIRTSWVISGTNPNFVSVMLRLASEGTVDVVTDQRGHPTLAVDLAQATSELLERRVSGLLHLTNQGTATWFELARQVVQMGGLDPSRVHPCTTEQFPRPAKRPANSVMESERLDEIGIKPMPDYRDGLAAIVESQMAALRAAT